MEIEQQRNAPSRGPSLPARLVVGGLALFGAITLVQWVLSSLIAIVKFGLVIVVLVGVVGWVLSAKGRR